MKSTKTSRIVLFDLDQTLIKTHSKAHSISYNETFKEIFNIYANSSDIEPYGKTERRIFKEVLLKHGIKREIINSKLKLALELMVKRFKENIKKYDDIQLNDGVVELLMKLREREHFISLITGNLKGIAQIKLDKAGIKNYFISGAFGDDFDKRSDLIRFIIKDLREILHSKFDKNHIFIIGDAIHDIDSGKEVGVKTIAVATGNYSMKELLTHEPNFLFENFKNPTKILEAIESQ